MLICISGLSGSGKNTVGALVAKKLKLREVKMSFKERAKKAKIGFMQYHRKAVRDKLLDIEFDRELVERSRRGNCVVMTWLGPWFVRNADFKVWLYASEPVRAQRVAKRERISLRSAARQVRERDAINMKRYRNLYGIDITDHGNFDIEIHTDKLTPKEIAEIIVKAALVKKEMRGGCRQ